jgi:hypothetical protein
VLSDDEFAALRDIERRLYRGSPELFGLFDSAVPHPAANRLKATRIKVLIAAVAFSGLALRGPRMLSEAEVRSQRRQPMPRTARADNAVAERTDPVSAPANAIGDEAIYLAQPIIATPPAVAHARKRNLAFATRNPSRPSPSAQRR